MAIILNHFNDKGFVIMNRIVLIIVLVAVAALAVALVGWGKYIIPHAPIMFESLDDFAAQQEDFVNITQYIRIKNVKVTYLGGQDDTVKDGFCLATNGEETEASGFWEVQLIRKHYVATTSSGQQIHFQAKMCPDAEEVDHAELYQMEGWYRGDGKGNNYMVVGRMHPIKPEEAAAQP